MPPRPRARGLAAPGRGRSRWSLRSAALLGTVAVLALVTAGCGPTTEASATPTRSAAALTTPVPGGAIGTEPSATSASSEPSVEPTEEPTPEATEEPIGSADSGAAAACTGTDENREFFVGVADAVDWPVYCPVLPRGWFVDSGQYRLAGGGWLEIAYRGPDGTRIELHEGAFCDEADGCVPAGADVGEAAFGDLDGTLVDAGDGTLAIVVERGASPSWLLLGTGLDEAAFRAIGADLGRVEG